MMYSVFCMTLMGACLPFCQDAAYRTEGGIVYARPGGEPLEATLYLPAASPESGARRPGIVLIHGGAWLTGSRRQMYWYGRRFAEQGYVAMSVGYRTMPGAPFPEPLEDVKSAVRWLRLHADEYQIDPDRIGAMGTSAGGHLTLMLALTPSQEAFAGTENPGVSCAVQAAVSLYGPTDLSGFEQSKKRNVMPSARMWKDYIEAFAGKEKRGNLTPLEAASPVSYVHADAPPILCVHGDKDGLVPVQQSRGFFDKLKAAGVPCEYIEMPGQHHAFDHIHPKVRRELFPRILSFLDEHLKK